jgi:hypothetical protein
VVLPSFTVWNVGRFVEDAEDEQAKGKITWAMELDGHGSATLATRQERLPQIV